MIRNYKLKGNDIVNADFKEPMIVGSFADGITRETKKKIVFDIMYGREMLGVYKRYRDDFNVVNVVDMLKEMEKIFAEWDYKNFEASREPLRGKMGNEP